MKMENNHCEEVNELLGSTPRKLVLYSIVAIFFNLLLILGGSYLLKDSFEIHSQVIIIHTANDRPKIEDNEFQNKSVEEDASGFLLLTSAVLGQMGVPEADYSRIKINNTVNIELEEYPRERFGLIKGSVVSLADTPDTIYTDVDTVCYYKVKAVFDLPLKTTYNINIPLKSQMKGHAVILCETESYWELFWESLALNKLWNDENM